MVHQWDLPLKDLAAHSYVTYISTLFYVLVVAHVKIAILLEFEAIFVPRGTRNYFFWITYFTIGVIFLWNVIGFVLINVNCSPYDGNWNPFATGRFCRFDVAKLSVASAATNFVFDMVPLFLPQRIIWGLHISWTKKLGVSVIFLVGILGCTSALIRLVYVVKFMESSDTTYFYSIVMAITGIAQTRAFAILKSWTTSLRASRGSGSGPSWPSRSRLKKRKQDVEQGFDEQPLATTHPVKTGQYEPAITIVTRISLTEDYNAYPGDVDDYFPRGLRSHGGLGRHTQ